MFHSVSALKTVSLALAAGLGLAPAIATATPVTLRYDFTAVVTSTSYFHECYAFGDCADYEDAGFATTYQGSAAGSSGSGWLDVSFNDVDTANGLADFSYAFLGLRQVTLGQAITDFGAEPSVTLEAFNEFDLFQAGFARRAAPATSATSRTSREWTLPRSGSASRMSLSPS